MQPCLILWNQRQYQQRVWHLLQEWRRRRPEPLEWVLHMTNTLVLPIHTWGTADLDHELSRDEPFAPDWLRTETTGRQIGNLPLSLYAVVGSENRVLRRLAETLPKRDVDLIRDRAEWGMRVVHEIQHPGPLDKLLTDFGYGTDRVVVHPYWAESPVLSVQPEQVKWLVLSSPSQQRLLVVLASWSAEKTAAELRLDAKSIGLCRRRRQGARRGNRPDDCYGPRGFAAPGIARPLRRSPAGVRSRHVIRRRPLLAVWLPTRGAQDHSKRNQYVC